MDVLTLNPPESLETYIKHLSFIETKGAGMPEKILVPVVDGCPGIIIQNDDYGTLFRQEKKLPSAFLFGQSTRCSELKLHGEFQAMCVYLQPHAIGSLFHLNAETLTDSCLDLTSFPKWRELLEKLKYPTEKQDKINLLNTYLKSDVAGKAHRDDAVISYVLEKIISSKGTCSLKELQAEVRLSERSLERKFKHQVGISAKLFSRICKFQSSFKQVTNKDSKKLTEIAFENDYADQSHFLRTFKEFTGFPPLQYRKKLISTADNLAEIIF